MREEEARLRERYGEIQLDAESNWNHNEHLKC